MAIIVPLTALGCVGVRLIANVGDEEGSVVLTTSNALGVRAIIWCDVISADNGGDVGGALDALLTKPGKHLLGIWEPGLVHSEDFEVFLYVYVDVDTIQGDLVLPVQVDYLLPLLAASIAKGTLW